MPSTIAISFYLRLSEELTYIYGLNFFKSPDNLYGFPDSLEGGLVVTGE